VDRLYRAFRRIFKRLSDEQLQNFWSLSPQLICLRSRGKVFRTSGDPVIYLAPSVLRMTDDNLANVIADEVGHLILSHHDPDDKRFDPRHHDQTEADKAVSALVEQWGFKRPHTVDEPRRPREQEKQSSRRARAPQERIVDEVPHALAITCRHCAPHEPPPEF
jgi:predicted SprT family Zn-dependent metalloprotease